jgi:hypothetical protein
MGLKKIGGGFGFIEELDIIEKILRHLGHCDIRNHDPPQPVTSDSIPDMVYDFSDSQIR